MKKFIVIIMSLIILNPIIVAAKNKETTNLYISEINNTTEIINVPDTDKSNSIVWMVLLFVSTKVIFFGYLYSKKKKKAS